MTLCKIINDFRTKRRNKEVGVGVSPLKPPLKPPLRPLKKAVKKRATKKAKKPVLYLYGYEQDGATVHVRRWARRNA